MPVVAFYWLVNEQGDTACQPVNVVNTALYVILYCSILFHYIILQRRKQIHKSTNTIGKKKGSSYKLDTPETKIRILFYVTNNVKPHLDFEVGLSQ